MHGLLGIANYLFSRKSEIAKKNLVRILSILDQLKVEDGDLIYWESSDDLNDSNSLVYVNLGYAHGIPSILYFLSKFIVSNINADRATYLFNKGFAYLLSHQNTSSLTNFPSYIGKEKIIKNNRVAFCYGDLGISSGLTAIALTLNDCKILELAKNIATNIARVSINNKEKFEDIGICHGAAGNGHMFLRLYNTHKVRILKDAAIFQYQKLLTFRNTNTGIAGFMSKDFNDQTEKIFYKTDPSFINGTSGIGLSILSFLNNTKKTNWDAVLCLR